MSDVTSPLTASTSSVRAESPLYDAFSSAPVTAQPIDPVGNSSFPSWLGVPDASAHVTPMTYSNQSEQKKALLRTQFEMAFPSILDLISGGSTLDQALDDHAKFSDKLDKGAFLRWIRSNKERAALYSEAKELRAECWSGRVIEIAEGTNGPEDVQRSKLKIDTYKWAMGVDDRKTYGDYKQMQIDINQLSVTAAIDAGKLRISQPLPDLPELSDIYDLSNLSPPIDVTPEQDDEEA